MIQFDVFKDGKGFALTMSYDDGSPNDRRLAPLFDRYGIRGTFHLNSNRMLHSTDGSIRPEEVKDVYKNHEVAAHTYHHGWLEKMPDVSVINEVLNDRLELEKACGYIVRGMSYPFGTNNQRVRDLIKSCGIVYSRTANSTNRFDIPNDFLAWHPTCHHNGAPECAKRFLETVKSGWAKGKLLYIWGHAHELTDESDWEMMEELCKSLSNLENVWYATNIEIYDYVTAQRSLHIAADESAVHNPSQIDVWINKDGQTVKIPAGETVIF